MLLCSHEKHLPLSGTAVPSPGSRLWDWSCLQALSIPRISEHHFPAFLQMCVQALPRLHARITDLTLKSFVSEIGRDFWGLAEAIVPLPQPEKVQMHHHRNNRISKIPLIFLLHNRKEKLFLCSPSSLKSKKQNVFPFMGFKAERSCCNYLAFLPQHNSSRGPPFSNPSCLPL